MEQSRKQLQPSMIEGLPREIVLDILSRLPISSLLETKRVCRAWQSIANDPHLVPIHFTRATERDPLLILHSDCPNPNELYFVDAPDPRKNNVCAVTQINVPELLKFKVVGSCNGLLCLLDASLTIYIYNPFTRNYWRMPKSKGHSVNRVFGFGFHPTAKEYKVVAVASTFDFSKRGFRGNPTSPGSSADVLTVGSSTWRKLGIIPYHFVHPLSQVLVCGRLHWDASPNRVRRKGHLIVSFDLADEQFQEVAKPACGSLDNIRYQVVALGGHLAVIVHFDDGKLEIWIMKVYGEQDSWTKEFVIANYLPKGLELDVDTYFQVSSFYIRRSLPRVLCQMKNGELILEYKRRGLVSYNPTNETFKDLIFRGMPNWFLAIVHLGSLNQIDTSIINV